MCVCAVQMPHAVYTEFKRDENKMEGERDGAAAALYNGKRSGNDTIGASLCTNG